MLTAGIAVISGNAEDQTGPKTLSKSEITKKYDQNGDGTMDYREKMTFLRSLDENGRAAYRRAFFSDNQQKNAQNNNRDADWAREAIERHNASRAQNTSRAEGNDRRDSSRKPQTRKPSSRGDDARKAWAERVKKYQEERAKAAQGSSSQGRGNSRSSQNRQPSTREQGGSREQANRFDLEAVKRRLDYGVKEGLLTRDQAGKLMAEAKKRIEVDQRGGNDRRGQGANNEGRGRESQSNDRQDQARKGYEVRRKRIEEGVGSGKIKREDAGKMLEDLRKRMAAASRGEDSNAHTNQQRGGEGNERKEREDDPRVAKYKAAERALAAAVKAKKLSKEDAEKKLLGVRKQLWSSDASRSSQSKSSQSRGSSRSRAPQRSSGTDWRKAIEERMKKARDDRDRAERNSRDRGNDRGHSERGEDMRKAWEERIKKYQAERAKAAQSRGSRSSQSRGSSRSSQQRRPSGDDIRKAIAERIKQFAESRKKMSPQRGSTRSPQSHGPQRGGTRSPQGHGQQRGGPRGR